MYNFKKSILDFIDIYTIICEYKEKNISLTRALAHYLKNNNCFELTEYNDIKDIKKLYKNYIIDNNLPVDNDNSDS